MPVTSQCPQCQQLLRVPRRKVGTSIDCPGCGTVFIATRIGQVAGVGVLGEETLPQSPGGFDEVPALLAEIPAPRPAAPIPRPMILSPAMQTWADPVESSPEPSVRLALGPEGGSWLLVARWMVYMQALLLIVVGTLGFVCGYVAADRQQTSSHSAASRAAVPAKKEEQIKLSGTVVYTGIGGAVESDANAVAIALPIGVVPRHKISVRGLHPQDEASQFTRLGIEAIRALGGDYRRANAQGAFQLSLPRPGEYYVLTVSAHAPRPRSMPIEDQTLSGLANVFESGSDLIGSWQYRWTWQSFKDDALTTPPPALNLKFTAP
jgi:hypothetical protein